MEPAVIGAISGLVVAGLAVLGFWLNWSDRLARAQNKGEQAVRMAAEAQSEAREAQAEVRQANERVTAQAAQFALYREQAVREFVARETITEMEKRLVQSQAKTEQRLVDAIDGLTSRLDRIIEVGMRGAGRHEVT